MGINKHKVQESTNLAIFTGIINNETIWHCKAMRVFNNYFVVLTSSDIIRRIHSCWKCQSQDTPDASSVAMKENLLISQSHPTSLKTLEVASAVLQSLKWQLKTNYNPAVMWLNHGIGGIKKRKNYNILIHEPTLQWKSLRHIHKLQYVDVMSINNLLEVTIRVFYSLYHWLFLI